MGIKCISTHGEAADIAIEVASMKFKKKHPVVVAFVIVSIPFVIIFILGVILQVDSATTGLTHSYIKTIGSAIAYSLKESNSFPRDSGSDDKNHQAGQFNQWHSLFDVDKLLSDSGRRIDKDIPKAYFDSSIWIVAKNIPDDPPPNLIILATRNVEPSSLRTRLADEDMQKHIRFREKYDDLMILRKYAVLFFADGMCTSVPLVSPKSRRGNRITYRSIYRNQPFDLTTNLVSGLQVKYLTPEGEITPIND